MARRCAATSTGLAELRAAEARRNDPHVFSSAFDLLELDGNDLRREPFEVRKATLASLLRPRLPGLQFNQHLTHPGDIVFRHACAMGLEGIVSKRLGSTIHVRPHARLAQVQEPGGAGGPSRGRRGLGK